MSGLVGIRSEVEPFESEAGALEARFGEGPDDLAALNPQPIPPGLEGGEAVLAAGVASGQPLRGVGEPVSGWEGPGLAGTRVGEVRMLPPAKAAQVENLTLASTAAPWHIFPRCFYSKQLVARPRPTAMGRSVLLQLAAHPLARRAPSVRRTPGHHRPCDPGYRWSRPSFTLILHQHAVCHQRLP
jgi:hypothetical protein